jgi:hypothetical protein
MTNEKFFKRNREIINRVVRNRLAKTKRVIHGSRAQNVQLPRFLERRPTVDWDVFARNPDLAAHGMERALDKKFRGDFFGIRKGITEKLKVRKVFSKVTGESFVDFSIPDRVVPTKGIRGKRFATLKDQFEKAKSNLKDPTKAFRADKDRSLVRRVREFQRLRGRKL